MMSPEFLILGPLEARAEGRSIELSGRKQRLLLAMLVAQAGDRMSCDRLIDGIWGPDGTEGTLHTLRVHISNLRRVLDPNRARGSASSVIETVEDGYRLRVTDGMLDSVEFEHLVREGRHLLDQDDHEAGAQVLRDALTMWRGPAFGELGEEMILRAEATRLEELRLGVIEDRIGADLQLGRHNELIAELRDLVDLYPFREHLYGLLMTALYRAGRQTEALRTYRALAQTLGDELGIVPGPEVRDLEERILLQDPALDLPDFRGTVSSNLPASTTSFVGREEDVAQIQVLSGETRLLTFIGPGGVGKTRLALEAAAGMAGRFPDGVWLVELSPLRDPMLVGQTIADALGIDQQPDRPVVDTLIDRVGRSTPLVILDNCEHLIQETAAVAHRLLQGCPGLRVWATSREPLGLTGERRFAVSGLSMPDTGSAGNVDDFGSVQLFIDRARDSQHRFELDADNATAVAQICRQLDGIPLAIELAAARSAILTAQQIAAQLDNRFQLLRSSSRDTAARQQTLEATLEWSHELLSDNEQKMLRRVSAFRGSFDLDAAAAVCLGNKQASIAALDVVDQLVAKSLLSSDSMGEQTRYRALESVRLYARAKLASSGEEADVLDRHRYWYASLADEAGPRLRGKDQLIWLKRLEVDHDNLRAAMDRSSEVGDISTSLRIAGSIAWFWFLHSHLAEGWDRLNSLVEQRQVAPDHAILRVLISAGQFAWEQSKDAQARAWLEEAVELAEQLGSDRHRAWALSYLGLLATLEGRWQEAIGLATDASELFEATGGLAGFGFSTWIDSGASYFQARDEGVSTNARSEQFVGRVEVLLDMAQQIGDRNFIGHLHWSLGIAAFDRDEFAESAEHLKVALEAFRDLGNKSCAGHTVDQVAALEIAMGRPKEAARLLAATEALRSRLGIRGHVFERQIWENGRDRVEGILPSDRLHESWEDGSFMDFDHVVTSALSSLIDTSAT